MTRRIASLLAALSLFVALSTTAGATGPQHLPHEALQYKRALVASAHYEFGLDAPIADLAAQLEAESGWRTDAHSGVGAQGLAQFMPATALDLAEQRPDICAPANPFSASWAIRCQAAYMHSLYIALKPMPSPRYTPTLAQIPECDHWAMTFAAYNGGIGWLMRDRVLTIAAPGDPNRWFGFVEFYTKRNAAAERENRSYPLKIMRDFAPKYVADSWGRAVVCEWK
jgi:soluble lytic murein transglycosylase-like protein